MEILLPRHYYYNQIGNGLNPLPPISRFLFLVVGAISIVTLSGCTAHSCLEPVGKGNSAYRASFGGPVIEAFGINIPVPLTAVGGEAGISENVNLNADLHILPFFYEIAGGEIGGTWFPVIQNGRKPTVGIGGRMLMMASFRSGVNTRFKAYPILSITTAWNNGPKQLYLGSDLTIPLSDLDYDQDVSHAMLSSFTGFRWKVSQNYRLGLELKWQGANIESTRLAVDYRGLAGKGAIAPFITLERVK